MSHREVGALVDRAVAGGHLRRSEIETLLSVEDAATAGLLFEGAQALREKHFGNKVFLYGFVYFSTHCRNRCTFCFYRRGNEASPRYRKSPDEVVAIACGLAASGVHLVDLTMGEDPDIHDTGDFDAIVELARRVRADAGVPVMVSPGVVPKVTLEALCESGADWYACYQETHTPELYDRLRPQQDYVERAATRSEALGVGLHVEDGILLGVGETAADRARSLVTMRAQGVQQARVMGFVPQAGTPLAGREAPSLLAEMVTLATMRLTMPDRLIPASLDIDGLRGLEARLRAGANVVTSIIPPDSGLAGVSQSKLDIDEGFRTVEGVERHLAPLGLETATLAEYEGWLEGSKAPAVKAQAR
ncbi:MAG: methylornithine synthase PylB [Thermoleophilia bacterium]